MNAAQSFNQIPTPYNDLNRVLQELANSINEVLREDLIGAYLQGSFAVGDFDLHSDVDFIVIVQQNLTQTQVDSLQRMHERIYNINSRWAKHLEGSYFPKAIISKPPRYGEEIWFLNNGWHNLIRSDHCNTLLVRFVVREHGITLVGPSPETLIEPISTDALRKEIYTVMNRWGQEIFNDPEIINNRFYQAYGVLNYCRMLHDLYRGQAGSKLAGAEWMLYNGFAEEWAGLIERSWARRVNPANWVGLPADPDDYQATLEFIHYVIDLGHKFMKTHA